MTREINASVQQASDGMNQVSDSVSDKHAFGPADRL